MNQTAPETAPTSDSTTSPPPPEWAAAHARAVTGCARCGGDHPEVVFKRFERPFAPADLTSVVWSWWGACPETGDPILVAFT